MTIVTAGSIATDHLMVFPGRFSEQLIDGQLDRISLSFLVDELSIYPGGVGADIAFGLGCLGLRPVLVGAVGNDFAEYRQWLESHNVNTEHVRVSETRHTARFLCTTDADQNQIASFYPGAMSEAREIDLPAIARSLGSVDLVVISPDDPAAMVRHTQGCRKAELPFAADPSQQLARLEGDDIRELVNGADYLFTNEYERELLQQKTAWSSEEIMDRVRTWVTTRGADGVSIISHGHEQVTVPVVPPRQLADPTGVGDAFRAGYLAGTFSGLDTERSAQVGCTLATLAIETIGSQEYGFEPAEFVKRLGEAYGPEAAEEVRDTLGSTMSA